jgi:hypothetical protein
MRLRELVNSGEYLRDDGRKLDDFQLPLLKYLPKITDISSQTEATLAAQKYGWRNIPPMFRPKDWGAQQFHYQIKRFGEDYLSNPE